MAYDKGVIAWWARNPVAANLLMIIILAAGLLSSASIKRTMMPEFEIDFLVITMAYPGAAPEEVEKGIVYKIEEAIADLEGIDRVESDSIESMARIMIEPVDSDNLFELMNDIQNRIDAIQHFPEGAEKPVIGRIEIPLEAMMIQIAGDLDERAMKSLAEEVKSDLLAFPEISTVDVRGTRRYEIAIEISEARLREYQLSLDAVAKIIAASSLDLPGGSVKTENGDILLRTPGRAYREADFAEIVLRSNPDGTRLLLSDLARIEDGFEEGNGFSLFNEHYSVGLGIGALGPQDVISSAAIAKDYVERKNRILPDGVKLTVWSDFSAHLEQRLSMMVKNLTMGAVVVFFVLAFFLEIKLAFWVMVGIPICFMGSLALFGSPWVGGSLNLLSAFGFILVLGIVVDDAIIIGEAAYYEQEKSGHSIEAVVKGAKSVAVPATFGVLTTIAAFMPTLFIDGVFRPFGQAVGFVVVFCLIFSLIESKWILPAHLAHSSPVRSGWLRYLDRIQVASNRRLRHFVENHYAVLVQRCVEYRYSTLAGFIGILILIVGLVAGGMVRVVLAPEMEAESITVDLRMIDGTSKERTLEVITMVGGAIRDIDREYSIDGESSGTVVRNVFAWGSSLTEASIIAELTGVELRSLAVPDLLRLWRERVGIIGDAELLSFNAVEGPDIGADLSFDLQHSDWEILTQAAAELEAHLLGFAGLYDVQSTVSGVSDEFHIDLSPEAEMMGLTRYELGSQVRHAFYGVEAQRIQRDKEEIKVMVRYPEADRRETSSLDNMFVRTASGEAVPFRSVAELTVKSGYNRITHINYQRAVEVTADVETDIVEPGRITAELQEQFFPALVERYPGLRYNSSGMSREQELLVNSMSIGLILSLFAVFSLLAIPTRSYGQPLIIMGVIPFGIIGAVLGHILMGHAVSMLSLMGIIALSGVVVNDSLIMVEYSNRLVADGANRSEAVVQAGMRRFRAILLTSLTTFCGLIPILLEQSNQAQMIVPMAISLAFGIVFATVISLLLVPALYVILDDINRLFSAY
ncbi:MAG: multidrug efflux pump subunit AcrB [Halieaceae bacterium]|jgi:multidrug efflux pump subunit AcrB